MFQKTKNWGKRLIDRFFRWLKTLYEKFIRTRFCLAVIMLIIGSTSVIVWYEGNEFYEEFLNAEPIVYTVVNSGEVSVMGLSVAHASTEKVESQEDQKESELGTEYHSSSPTAQNVENDVSKLAKKFKISPKEFERITKTVKTIADRNDFDWKIPVAIILTESKGGKIMEGDNGLSKGWYHIYHVNVCELNGNRPNCIQSENRFDLEKSTQWAIERLKRHESLGRSEMIRSHNGLIEDKSNQWYVDYVEKLIKEL